MSDITCIDNNKRDGLQIFLKPIQAIGSQVDDIAFFGIVWVANQVKKGFISGLNEKTTKEITALYDEMTDLGLNQKITEPEKIFDEALQKINSALAKCPVKKEALNLLFGLKCKNKVLFSYIGKILPLLVERKSRGEITVSPLNNLLKKESDKRFFPKFISGTLDFHQSIFFSTDNVSVYFTPLRLGTLLFSSSNALWQLKNSVAKLDAKLPFAALHILYKNKDSTTSLGSMENLIATETRTSQIISPSVIPHLIPVARKVGGIVAKVSTISSCWLNQKFHEAQEIIQDIKSRRAAEEITVDYNSIPEATEAFESAEIIVDEETSSPEPTMIMEEIIEESDAPHKDNLIQVFLKKTLSKAIPQPTAVIEKFNILPFSKKILFIFLIIVIFFFTQSILFANRARQAAALAIVISQIEQNITDSKAGLIYGDETGAMALYQTASNSFAALQQKNRLSQEIKNKLTGELSGLYKILRHETDLDGKLLFQFQNQKKPTALLSLNNNIYLLSDNSLLKYNQKTSVLEVIYQNVSINFKAAALDADKNSITLTDGVTFISVNLKDKAPTIRQNASLDIKDINAYGGKLYVLSGNPLSLQRLVPTQDGFAITTWLKDGVNIDKAKSIAIDGYIYLLRENGNVLKFLNGRQRTFDLSAIEPSLAHPDKILTYPESDNLYILDSANQRIASFDKKGKLLTQYAIKGLEKIIDFAVSEKDKKIYLLNDVGLFEANTTQP